MENTGVNFCKECHNMTFIHETEEKTLVHVCKNCGFTEDFKNETACIYSSNFSKFDVSTFLNQNKYITHDKTLPSIKNNANIVCPNDECLTNAEKVDKSFKYIKYDEDQMKFMYVCETCGQSWTN
jgi:DNA-directed RNA polymerase subunit M/transcription elongation factor TFIIS